MPSVSEIKPDIILVERRRVFFISYFVEIEPAVFHRNVWHSQVEQLNSL